MSSKQQKQRCFLDVGLLIIVFSKRNSHGSASHLLEDQLSAASSIPQPTTWPTLQGAYMGSSTGSGGWSRDSTVKTHPQDRPAANCLLTATGGMQGGMTQVTKLVRALDLIIMVEQKGKGWQKEKSTGNANTWLWNHQAELCWVHGQIQWPSGNLTCWMSQEYALLVIRQCHVIWLQQ